VRSHLAFLPPGILLLAQQLLHLLVHELFLLVGDHVLNNSGNVQELDLPQFGVNDRPVALILVFQEVNDAQLAVDLCVDN